MLLNISNKYQSLLILNAKIIDATQKKLLAKNVDNISLWKISLFIRSRSFRKQ